MRIAPIRTKPFVGINCTVLPESLLESELFGHEKGAFTARSKENRKIRDCPTRDDLPDEIATSRPLSEKLLRFFKNGNLSESEGTRSSMSKGGSYGNKQISNMMEGRGSSGKIVPTRFNVVPIHLPHAATEKRVPLLANYFLSRYNIN